MNPEPRFHMGRCHCGHGWRQVWHRDRGWECRRCYEGRAIERHGIVVPANVIDKLERMVADHSISDG